MNSIISLAVAAAIAVESGNNPNVPDGDGGRAVGVAQMWPVAVKEANRLEAMHARREGRTPRRWTLRDRRDPVASRAMVVATLAAHYRWGVTDPVELACKWRNPYSAAPEWHRKKIKAAVEAAGGGK
jgi:hypothetical protein